MTDNGVGVIPFTDEQEASYKYLKLKTENNGVIAAHDTESLGPRTVVLEDFEDNPSNNWSVWDSSLSLTSRSYEGSQAVYFGGVGDGTSLAEKIIEER